MCRKPLSAQSRNAGEQNGKAAAECQKKRDARADQRRNQIALNDFARVVNRLAVFGKGDARPKSSRHDIGSRFGTFDLGNGERGVNAHVKSDQKDKQNTENRRNVGHEKTITGRSGYNNPLILMASRRKCAFFTLTEHKCRKRLKKIRVTAKAT